MVVLQKKLVEPLTVEVVGVVMDAVIGADAMTLHQHEQQQHTCLS
jgi:hypothetical protein